MTENKENINTSEKSLNNNSECKNKLTIGKILLLILLGLIILIGIFGAVCGGFFTITSLLSKQGYDSFFIISIPSLIIGLLIIFGGYRWFKKILKGKNNEKKVSDIKETEL